jgi:hypothetical protein
MLRRMHVLFLLLPVFTFVTIAGGKKKSSLPPYVLTARTVVVLIDPDAGTSVKAPLANKTAQEDVEKAFMKWGRFTVVPGTPGADLVVTVRKGSGKLVQPTIGGLPTNDRPVTVESTDNTVRIGAQQGRDPGLQQSGPSDVGPHPQVEVGAAEDMMVVYQGHVDRPLDQPAVWRYMASGALHSPDVPAVEKFRKAIVEAEKQLKSNP